MPDHRVQAFSQRGIEYRHPKIGNQKYRRILNIISVFGAIQINIMNFLVGMVIDNVVDIEIAVNENREGRGNLCLDIRTLPDKLLRRQNMQIADLFFMAIKIRMDIADIFQPGSQLLHIIRSGLLILLLGFQAWNKLQIRQYPQMENALITVTTAYPGANAEILAETVAARQEKMLVFTQFQETTAPLAAFLGGVFGREGLVLHGGTPVARRRELVKRFQQDEQLPFFVLSIKAGGSGLNLTAASHVVHFDRWWNPAVENQATDRAYRIGQHRNVLVHKFITRGTIEERIDALIQAKQQLVQDVVEGGGEINLTEMSDAALMDLVKLDINAAGV